MGRETAAPSPARKSVKLRKEGKMLRPGWANPNGYAKETFRPAPRMNFHASFL
jgi:hypothetical protein